MSFNESTTVKLCFIGDAGNSLTKLGIFVINTRTLSSPRNISLIGIYKEADIAANLDKAFNKLFSQSKLPIT